MPTDRKKGGPRGIAGRAPRHGARALSRLYAAQQLDRRTALARDLDTLRDGLAADRGGWANTTTAEQAAIELAAMEMTLLRMIFTWAARQPSIIVEGEDGARLLGPLAKGFTSHAGALTRALSALGMRPDKVSRLASTCADCGRSFPTPDAYLRHPCPADPTAAPVGSTTPAAVTTTAVAGTATEDPTP